MSPYEIGDWIIRRWIAEDPPMLIVWQLAHTSAPLTLAEVMRVVRAYIDEHSENLNLKRTA